MGEPSGKFNIKVLSGGNIMLVERPGYDAEMFIPVIINNRIALCNAIESRRCCKCVPENIQKSVGNRSETARHSCDTFNQPPVANSTPVRTSKSSKENQNPTRRFSTPDIVRRAAVRDKNVSATIPGVGGFKIVRLYHDPTQHTAKKLVRIAPLSSSHSVLRISPHTSQTNILRNVSKMSTFRTPPRLHSTTQSTRIVSPNQSFLLTGSMSPVSAIKWRKCKTPQRTYIRRSNRRSAPSLLKTMPAQFPLMGKNGQLVPDFCRNPTQNPTGGGEVIRVKRRKLLIDIKLMITPKTFKNQLKHTEDLNRKDYTLPKNRKRLIASQLTAFDLLTNSSYYPRIANDLNVQFRKGCLHKQADTILKYQQLTRAIPSIESVQ